EQDNGGQVALFWQLSSDDGSGVNDVLQYHIERSLNGANNFSPVGSISAGNNSFIDSSSVDGTLYDYRVIAEDLGGNRSTSVVYGPIASIDNNSIVDAQPAEDVTGLNAVAGNERIALSWTASADSNLDLVDQLLAISTDGGVSWGVDISLGKLNTTHLQEGLTNGVTYRFRLRVKDSSGNISVGVQTADIMPSANAYTSVSGTIGSDTEWAAGVYRVTGSITINAGATLTIKPGVIVKFNSGQRLTVNGDLVAEGSVGNEVIFTSYRDDSVGGDTNGDGASVGVEGDWLYLLFNSGVNSAVSRLTHVDVRYGGSSSGSVYLSNSTLPITNSTIHFSKTHGLHIRTSSAVISGNTFEDNINSGLYSYNSSAVFESNTFQRNQHGLFIDYGSPSIHNNTLQNNAGYGVYDNRNSIVQVPTGNTITGNAVPLRLTFSALPGTGDGNTITGNTRNQIEFYGNALSRNLELSADILYYQVGSTATINTGVNVRLQPGVIWKFTANSYLTINGALGAIGTATDKIIFTSYRDDSAGGDSNNDGFSTGSAGDWARIYLSDTVIDFLTRFDYTEVRYGGSSTASIYQSSANVDITNSVIRNSANQGIYLQYSYPLIENNEITEVANAAIYLNSGANQATIRNNRLADSTYGIFSRYDMKPIIDGNEITGNSSWGIYFTSGYSVPVITNNTVTGNGAPVILPASAMPNSTDNNVLLPNSSNYIIIRGNARYSDLHLEVLRSGDAELNTYRIATGHLDMHVGTTLTLDPGVNIKVDNNLYLYVRGSIEALGTADDRIVLTSLYDDSVGFKTATGVARNGLWYGLYIYPGAISSNLSYMDIRYAGYSNWGALYVDEDTTASNMRISQSGSYGVLVGTDAVLTLSDSEIFGTISDGIHCNSGNRVDITNSRVYANGRHGFYFRSNCLGGISNTEIFGNSSYGMYSDGTVTIAAEGNWWGSADGPSGVGVGSGDQVAANIDYADLLGTGGWLTDGTAFSYFNAGGT
ncbi:MAG: right-handed parallel beta-helix repeat-containing protein, partial [Gammaproteobacteria bacterium]|nr:right-handed parallel beta-helix repeat-containing protein [Gammaproteobacteria bacterium]